MIKGDGCYIIDFQGARPGPLQYDLAALLIDPYTQLPATLQENLFAYACERIQKGLTCDMVRFKRGYRLCRVTRNLQILGAFAFLSQVKGKPGFEPHIPAAAASLVDHLDHPDLPPCPRLKSLAAEAAAIVHDKKARTHAKD